MKRFLKILLVVVSALVILAALAPAILSTGFGRWVVEGCLSVRLNREVSIGGLDVGWMSGVRMQQLTIAERPEFGDEPFVKLESLSLPHPLLTILWDETLSELRVTKAEVSLVRRADGKLSIDDLRGQKEGEKKPAGPAAPGEATAREQRSRPGYVAPIRIEGGRLRYSDGPLGTSVVLEEFAAAATYDHGLIKVTQGRGRLNDGALAVEGELDLREKPEPFKVKLSVKDAQAAGNLWGEGQLAPIMHNPQGKTKGRVSLEVSLAGRGLGKAELKANLSGESHLVAREVEIEGSPMIKELVSLLGGVLKIEKDTLTLDEIEAKGRIGGGRVTNDMIRAARGETFTLSMTGYTEFDGKLEYRISVGGTKTDKYLLGLNRYVGVKLRGTLSKPKFSLGSTSPDTSLLDGLIEQFGGKKAKK